MKISIAEPPTAARIGTLGTKDSRRSRNFNASIMEVSRHLHYKQPLIIGCFLAAVSGILLTLAFPGPGLDWLSWIAMVPLMVTIHTMPPKQAFYIGLVAGMVHFLSLLYWIVPTIQTYGGIPLVLSFSVLLLLCFYLSLYVGLFCAGMTLLNKTSASTSSFFRVSFWMPLGAAALWTGAEYLRARLFTGFPWGCLGYCLYTRLTLIQIADFSGVYGVSFVIVMVNASLARIWILRGRKKMAVSLIGSMLFCTLLVLALAGYGKLRQEEISAAMEHGQKTKVSVIQGNIDQADKWDLQYQESTVDTYCNLSRLAGVENPDLIVWPETALPFYYGLDRNLSRMVDECIKTVGTSFLVGSPALGKNAQGYTYTNRAHMIDSFSFVTGQYDKIHLVPFGEYVPLGRYLTFLGKLTAQAGDFSSGKKNALPLAYDNGSAGILICFEVIFPELARNMVNKGARILVTITNDAWFGRTSAPVQHFSMAVFRAVENKRAVARAANTGISGFIDPLGRIMATTSLYTRTVLTRSLSFVNTTTLYSRYGDWFAIICLVAMALVFMVKRIFRTNFLTFDDQEI